MTYILWERASEQVPIEKRHYTTQPHAFRHNCNGGNVLAVVGRFHWCFTMRVYKKHPKPVHLEAVPHQENTQATPLSLHSAGLSHV